MNSFYLICTPIYVFFRYNQLDSRSSYGYTSNSHSVSEQSLLGELAKKMSNNVPDYYSKVLKRLDDLKAEISSPTLEMDPENTKLNVILKYLFEGAS